VILLALPWQKWLREYASVLCLYLHRLYCKACQIIRNRLGTAVNKSVTACIDSGGGCFEHLLWTV